jgi:hypothetical protein
MAELADFDLLRDTTGDIRSRPWTKPQYREAMVLHFRIKRAKEEIHRLNIEIRRQATYMRDEYTLHRLTVNRLKGEDPNFAAFIEREAEYLDIVFAHITYSLIKTRALPGFSGTLEPGSRKDMATSSESQTMGPEPRWLQSLNGNETQTMGEQTTLGDSQADGDVEFEEDTMMDIMESIVFST